MALITGFSNKVLMRQPRYANIQLLLRHRRKPVSIREYEIRRIMTARRRVTRAEAKAGDYGPMARAILSSLTTEGFLSRMKANSY